MSLWKNIKTLMRGKPDKPEWYFETCPRCGYKSGIGKVEHCMRCLHSEAPGWSEHLHRTGLFIKGELSFKDYTNPPKETLH